ncbi:uncharacterized protein EV420DRAFT_1656108 [Desarmillaria tabescens]|uniref:Uncharacterized protein n=1 Tax=Armillaria tabescens TaxID=1929756 RepID=A0AA39IXZ9_ARMTA|nr:uncharacterized protein EV420DRAFT_1656108 [Desarmillaria tabescens]KAK0431940.1 hypothetical protein EV420DRAFT_1656108 [Desarmillaria tabescens]
MDQALQEEHQKWKQEHPDEAYDPTPPRPRWQEDPRFDDPKRPYKNPPILFDPSDEDESDVNLLQRVTENWDDDEDEEVGIIKQPESLSGYESDGSFGMNES